MVRGRRNRESAARAKAREASGRRAGAIFSAVKKTASKIVQAHMANILGGQSAFEVRTTTGPGRGRQMRISAESLKAVRRLDSLYREKRGKMPPEIIVRGGFRLLDVKNEILKQITSPEGEIKSFDEMRKFLKEQGICLNEGEFQTISNHLFNINEKKILASVFPQRKPNANPIGINETRFDWSSQEMQTARKKAA